MLLILPVLPYLLLDMQHNNSWWHQVWSKATGRCGGGIAILESGGGSEQLVSEPWLQLPRDQGGTLLAEALAGQAPPPMTGEDPIAKPSGVEPLVSVLGRMHPWSRKTALAKLESWPELSKRFCGLHSSWNAGMGIQKQLFPSASMHKVLCMHLAL